MGATAEVRALFDRFLAVIALYRLHAPNAEIEAIRLVDGDKTTPPLGAVVQSALHAVALLERTAA